MADVLRGREMALGFGYWLAFLLALEPGNIMGSHGLAWGVELGRIAGAATIGALATPFILAVVRRYPVEGKDWWQRAAVEAVAAVVIAAGLILLSCVLADRFLASEHRPFFTAVPQELTANGPLVMFCVAGLLAIGHLLRFRAERQDTLAPARAPLRFLSTIPVKARGGTRFVATKEIDWIETQGNYLALHAGDDVHLIRETLSKFEAQLDPARFVRVHRRTLVAADRIRAIEPLGQGDAQLTLNTGAVLRLSRTYRDCLQRIANV
ncbi:MAG TPA: LytTR family DNA-binding domain-containing protein [Rhizomicrobium sp.]|jgi:DNA-binding LytR/AlgR family response regulator